MSIDLTGKSSTIQALVELILQSPVGSRLVVVDHWDADLYAIGFTRRAGRAATVYVSTWNQPDGAFYWSIETEARAILRDGVTDATGLVEILSGCFPAPTARAI